MSWGSRVDDVNLGHRFGDAPFFFEAVWLSGRAVRRDQRYTAKREPPAIDCGHHGATGALYGVRLLEMLREAGVETHLVISPWGRRRCSTKPHTPSIRFSALRR